MHPSIILVLFALSATNALLPQLSSLAPRPVSQRVAASQLVAADPPPLQQKRRPRKPGGLLQSRRPFSRKQLKEPAFLWLNKELQWVAQDFLLMVEEESMGFLTVQERLGLGLGLANPNPHPHPHPHPHPLPNLSQAARLAQGCHRAGGAATRAAVLGSSVRAPGGRGGGGGGGGAG